MVPVAARSRRPAIRVVLQAVLAVPPGRLPDGGNARSRGEPLRVQERHAFLRPFPAHSAGDDRGGQRRACAERFQLSKRAELLREMEADRGGDDRADRCRLRPQRLELQGRLQHLRPRAASRASEARETAAAGASAAGSPNCRIGIGPCDPSGLTESEVADVERAQRRARRLRLQGRSCPAASYSELTPTEAREVALAERQRNLSNCRNGWDGMRPLQAGRPGSRGSGCRGADA